jgi:branched-chain amino acid transport system ATP-binding protein
MEDYFFELERISMNFGGLKALNNVNLKIRQGELRAIIGPNGSGKTTVFNIISGFYKPNSGKVKLNSAEITNLSPHEVCEIGIARTFQNIRLFLSLTAFDNVAAGTHSHMRSNFWSDMLHLKRSRRVAKLVEDQTSELLKMVGMLHKRKELCSNLSYGEQKRLEIARSLASNPKILLLDEPMAGMNTRESEEMTKLIQNIQSKQGITVLLIEQIGRASCRERV